MNLLTLQDNNWNVNSFKVITTINNSVDDFESFVYALYENSNIFKQKFFVFKEGMYPIATKTTGLLSIKLMSINNEFFELFVNIIKIMLFNKDDTCLGLEYKIDKDSFLIKIWYNNFFNYDMYNVILDKYKDKLLNISHKYKY